MTYARAPFGDGSTNVTSDVHTQYGPSDGLNTVGLVAESSGYTRTASAGVSGEAIQASVAFDRWGKGRLKLPAGAKIHQAWVEVDEAFTLGGTTPTILFGTEGSVDTNGVVVSEAQAEAVGRYDVTSTLTGTWAAVLAAATTVDVELGGTTPTVTDDGYIKLVLRYSW